MTDPDVVEAWMAVYEALGRLSGWEAARPVYNDGERLWVVTAFHTGHVRVGQRRPVMEARGATEAEALRELAEALEGRR